MKPENSRQMMKAELMQLLSTIDPESSDRCGPSAKSIVNQVYIDHQTLLSNVKAIIHDSRSVARWSA
eukprot:3071481-Amphidinium_carterae.2